MKLSFWVILILMFVITSCGGSGGKSNGRKKTRITEEQIQNVLENQVFSCDSIDGTPCPSGITRLLILNKNDADDSSVCSGFMVNEDTMITNQHCISSQADCNNTYVAIYTGSSYEQNKCKSVVKTLNDYSDPNDPRKKLDVAIVKLSGKYFGKTFEAASEKPLDYETVTAWVVDHTGLDKKEANLFESRITELRCSVSSDRSFQSLLLDYCPVIDGNSGSPLLDGRGDVAGIIWGGSAADINSSLDLKKRRELNKKAAATEVKFFSSYMD